MVRRGVLPLSIVCLLIALVAATGESILFLRIAS